MTVWEFTTMPSEFCKSPSGFFLDLHEFVNDLHDLFWPSGLFYDRLEFHPSIPDFLLAFRVPPDPKKFRLAFRIFLWPSGFCRGLQD